MLKQLISYTDSYIVLTPFTIHEKKELFQGTGDLYG